MPSLKMASSDHESEFDFECRAIYLTMFDDTDAYIKNEDDFLALLQQSSRNPSKKFLKKHWTTDTSRISFSQFCDICKELPTTNENDLMKAFKRIDLNKDGFITVSELSKLLTSRGEKMSTEEARRIIAEVDQDGNGKLDFGEFAKMLTETSQKCIRLATERLKRKEQRHGRVPKSEAKKSTPGDPDAVKLTELVKSVEEAKSDESISKDTTSEEEGISVPVPKPRRSIGFLDNTERSTDLEKPLIHHEGGSKSRDSEEEGDTGVQPRHLVSKQELPSDYKNWKNAMSKGCFYFLGGDESSAMEIASHRFRLDIRHDTDCCITVSPYKLRHTKLSSPYVDVVILVLRESIMGKFKLVTATKYLTNVDTKEPTAFIKCRLEAGQYQLWPYTTGCRFKPRNDDDDDDPVFTKISHGKYSFTKAAKNMLKDIFDMVDLDNNGTLSFDEYRLYSNIAEMEDEEDDALNNMEDFHKLCDDVGVTLKDEELTLDGFLSILTAEIDQKTGKIDRLLDAISYLGYRSDFTLDEAFPYVVNVHCRTSEPQLKALKTDIEPIISADPYICEMAMTEKATVNNKVKGAKDLWVHTFTSDIFGCIVVENMGQHRVTLDIDCSDSKNAISNPSRLERKNVTCAANKKMIAMHQVPENIRESWKIDCIETLVSK